MYLELGTRKLTFKKAETKRLPVKAYVTLSIVLGTAPYEARVTNNRAWTGGDGKKALEYIWVEVDGVAGYVTLGYGEKAESLRGKTFVPKDGIGDPVTPRVTATKAATEREAARLKDFRKTWAEKYAPKAPAPAVEAPKEEVKS